ncbi:izumo sperm-egg fusion protein 3 isoform X2 [Dermochelys coriacea]|uniref:izumo sperm-egg fusion protein 3 isoform X2 n=1 Tax=Dermochelys coriacea TaxID=27794 RepID=UPI001CAA2BDB|nr:izumo sperm-egg fusion protein 3 isoform X2 [Dermochelys coriacea]
MRSQWGRGSMGMSCSLLLLLLLLLRPRGAGGCLHCDKPFLRGLGVLLREVVPSEVPDRDALIQRHVQAFEHLYSTHLPEKHHRVLDVRGVLAVKAALTSWLRALKETPWKGPAAPQQCPSIYPPGVHLLQLTLAQHRDSLRTLLRETLESFADLAVTEGPVLDCWTCLRISAQCFDGELCGEEDPQDAERKEITLYLFLVCQSVLLASAALLYCVCYRHRR